MEPASTFAALRMLIPSRRMTGPPGMGCTSVAARRVAVGTIPVALGIAVAWQLEDNHRLRMIDNEIRCAVERRPRDVQLVMDVLNSTLSQMEYYWTCLDCLCASESRTSSNIEFM